jgi:type II secretory ATPase GspE/PulE/Tfp pilus assembly ATPase PilB-like protein
MTSRDRLTFENIIRRPHGILLVTGPTGSGKTTTLYAALSRINSQDRNIISIEDPIENEIPGISQAQINPRAGLTFASALRSMLRQDPDVIMVGEIRDRETADISVRSAITGHLVFSTLHTNTAIGAITRMIDLGVEKFLLSSAILGVMAQRLVRRICPDCKVPADVDNAVRDKLGIPSGVTLHRGNGCKRCRMTGFLGRLGIFELAEISDELRAMVAQGIGEKELHDEAVRRGMSSIRNEAIGRAIEGETTIAEALRVTGEKE